MINVMHFNRSGGPLIASEHVQISINSEAFVNKPVHLTDARKVGVMLRDGRLTFREHSALTEFVVEAADDGDIILKTTVIDGDNAYIKVGDKGAFFATGSKGDAQKFQIVPTGLGLELNLDGKRPACFDGDHDVSIGKWRSGLSLIPILVHFGNPALIYVNVGGTQEGNGISSGSGVDTTDVNPPEQDNRKMNTRQIMAMMS